MSLCTGFVQVVLTFYVLEKTYKDLKGRIYRRRMAQQEGFLGQQAGISTKITLLNSLLDGKI